MIIKSFKTVLMATIVGTIGGVVCGAITAIALSVLIVVSKIEPIELLSAFPTYAVVGGLFGFFAGAGAGFLCGFHLLQTSNNNAPSVGWLFGLLIGALFGMGIGDAIIGPFGFFILGLIGGAVGAVGGKLSGRLFLELMGDDTAPVPTIV